nr:MAG TPA: hypothetical protein [Caudoviricetes sp.]
MLNLFDFGLSTFGRPAGDIESLPFLSHLYYIYVTPKSQYLFSKNFTQKLTPIFWEQYIQIHKSLADIQLSMFKQTGALLPLPLHFGNKR